MPAIRAAEQGSIRRSIARIVIPYAAFAAIWILLSDRALDRAFADPATLATYATLKGLAFVAVTATLLWILLRVEFSRRAAAERALRVTAAQLHRAQQVAHLGSWTWDVRSNRLEWSDEMFRIFGLDRATFSGDLREVVARAIHPDDREAVERANRDVAEGRGPTSLEYRVIRPDGTVRAVWAEGADLSTDERGIPQRLSGVVQDITERKQFEQQVLRAQRMEAVGALAAGIAHDLNNVLAPVMMIAPLLRARVTDADDREMLDTVAQCARRGSDIIRQLLTFARGEPGARVRLPLRHLIREMDRIARETFPRDIQLHVDAPRDLWWVEGDVTQVQQVLMNLCLNARDAMPGGGRLTIAAANVTLSDTEGARLDAGPGPYVRVTVSDTGTGIAPSDLPRIFDPFFTTRPPGRGAGLGLSSALGIVRGHGGIIRVQSEPGRGTSFDVYLPASPREEGPPAGPSVIASTGGGALVLVVDDEAAVRAALTQTLTAGGYRVVAAADGAEALAASDAHRADLAVVLTDLMMPGMSGAALVDELRARGVAVPIVTMSGVLGSDGAGAASAGQEGSLGEAAASLIKPFRPHDLLDTIDHVLRTTSPAGRTVDAAGPASRLPGDAASG